MLLATNQSRKLVRENALSVEVNTSHVCGEGDDDFNDDVKIVKYQLEYLHLTITRSTSKDLNGLKLNLTIVMLRFYLSTFTNKLQSTKLLTPT